METNNFKILGQSSEGIPLPSLLCAFLSSVEATHEFQLIELAFPGLKFGNNPKLPKKLQDQYDKIFSWVPSQPCPPKL